MHDICILPKNKLKMGAMILLLGEILPKFDLKKYDFDSYKGFFHGKVGPILLDFEKI